MLACLPKLQRDHSPHSRRLENIPMDSTDHPPVDSVTEDGQDIDLQA
jgi:hypothetical protein